MQHQLSECAVCLTTVNAVKRACTVRPPVPRQAAGLLDAAFWPQFHGVLAHWLAHAPDMDQVVSWYSGWRALLPQVRRRDRGQAQVSVEKPAGIGLSPLAGAAAGCARCRLSAATTVSADQVVADEQSHTTVSWSMCYESTRGCLPKRRVCVRGAASIDVLQDLRDDERVRAQLNAALNAMHGTGASAAQPQQQQQQQQQGSGGGAASAVPSDAPDPTAASRWGATAEEEDFTLRQLVRCHRISRALRM